MKRTFLTNGLIITVLLMLSLLIASCGDDEDSDETTDDTQVGTLVFTLNAEDFVRDGFDTEDNWHIVFDHVYINIQGPTAFQVALDEDGNVVEAKRTAKYTDRLLHAGHPHAEIPEGAANEALLGAYFVDGHEGPDPIELGRIEDAPIGNYNFLNFSVAKATADSAGIVDEFEGYSIVLIGTATNNDTSDEVSFRIRLTEEMTFVSCGPHPENIGVVDVGTVGTSEATFHFDHIFGDLEEGPADTDDSETVNYLAIGFGPFATLATDGVLDVEQSDLEALAEYDQFYDALLTLGHYGEAHCALEE